MNYLLPRGKFYSQVGISVNEVLKYRSATLRIVGIYALVGCLWIYTSDTVLYWFVQDTQITAKIAIYKGSFYVIFTSLLLYFLINRYNSNLAVSEQTLRESENKFRNIFDHSPIAIGIGDVQTGKMVEVNDAWLRLFGYVRDEVIGRSTEELRIYTVSEDRDEIIRIVKARGSIVNLPMKLRHKSGTFIEISYSAELIAIGSDPYLQVMMTDVSERKRADEALHLTRFSIDCSSDGFFWMTPDARIVNVNEAACRSLGYSREELLQLTIPDIDPFYNANVWRQHFIDLRQHGSLKFETVHTTKDGIQFPVEIVANYIMFDSEEYNCAIVRNIADRKKAEQALQYERDLTMDIINTQPAGVYRIRVFALETWENDAWRSSKTSPHVVEMASEPFYRILGTTKEDFENNPGQIIDLIYPDDREGFAKKNEEAAILLEEFIWEGRLLIDGVIRWVRLQSLPRPLENGDVLWTGALIDITDSKLTEENLLKKEYELEESQLLAGTGSWTYDPIAQNATWSRGMFHIWGIDPSLGLFPMEDHQKYIHPEDFPRFEAVLKEALENGTPYKEELRIIRPDGIEKTIITICEPICDATGKIVKLRGSIQDITERKQIENILSDLLQFSSLHPDADFFESLARYLSKTLDVEYVCIDRLHGDNLTATTLAVYHDGKFEDNVTYTLKDTPCGNVVGKVVCVYPENVSSLFPQDAALRELQAESYVGTTLWSFDMRPIGLIAVIGRKPMTNSLFSETVLKLVSNRAAGELERRQAEEEKHLLEQQFQQTQKLESLGVLSGGIAHDFNNILAIIIGNCSLAKMDKKNAEKYIPEIEKASERAAELCRQMLAYAGKAQFVQANVNFQSLVDDMVNMLKKTIPHNAEIKFVSATDIPLIQGDASQLNQVVMNLIINASEAIGKEHGEINVSLTETTISEVHTEKDYNGKVILPGQYVCLEVTDNGCGMDEVTKWRIFEPFYTTKFSGRGLGMSAVLGIITSHKGALKLHSRLDQGTAFKVYLPVSKKHSIEDQKQTIPSAPWQGSGTILLVEDEDQIRHIAKALLKRIGFTVLEALNGKEALDLYQKNATDITLVMTDMGMPIMDGYELFYELKKLNPELPIIVSSGYGDAEVSSRIDKEDIAGLISKPYGPDQLREVLKLALEGS